VVGRLVQQQNVRLLEQQPAQGHPPTFAARDHFDRRLAGRAAQSIHGHFEARVQVPGVQRVQFFLDGALAREGFIHLFVGHRLGEFFIDAIELLDERHRVTNGLLDHLPDRLGFVQPRFLFEKADGQSGRDHGLAHELRVHAGQDAQQRALARAVQPEHPDLGAVEIGQRDVLSTGRLS